MDRPCGGNASRAEGCLLGFEGRPLEGDGPIGVHKRSQAVFSTPPPVWHWIN